MGKIRHAQVSMEFLLVVAFIMIIVVPMVLYTADRSQSSATEVNAAQIGQIARRITSSAETVYSFGPPTTFTVKVYMPHGVESVNLSNNEVSFFVLGNNGNKFTINEVFSMNVSGNISNHQGIHNIRVTAANNAVIITDT